jgi:hypothetical protein
MGISFAEALDDQRDAQAIRTFQLVDERLLVEPPRRLTPDEWIEGAVRFADLLAAADMDRTAVAGIPYVFVISRFLDRF